MIVWAIGMVAAVMDSYAQNNEDVVLDRALKHVTSGIYVDVGAADPVVDSVTKLFSDRGWRGLNVEPVQPLAERLRSERPRDITFQVAAGAAPGRATLHQVADTGLSTLDPGSLDALRAQGLDVEDVDVEVAPLTTLIERAGLGDAEIHFLKVDVEGLERDVLVGLDLQRIRPWIVVVEATMPQSVESTAHEWEDLLVSANYRFTLFDGLNRFYVSAEHEELAPLVSYPACVFDQPFITRPHREALERIDELLASTASISAEYDKAIAAYTDIDRQLVDANDSYRRLEDQYTKTLDAYAGLEREYTSVLEKYHVAEQERQSQEGELAAFRAGVAEMADELQRAREDADHARAHAAQSERSVAVVYASTSWRITSPLRAVVDRLRSR